MSLLKIILVVTIEAGALLFVSRLLFVSVISATANRRGKGPVVGFLRLPGNLVHEFSHCVGYLLGGYTVRRVVLCIFDRQGRGSCSPGRPWSPLAFPWLATGLAALMPLVAGSVLLYVLSQWLGIMQPPPIPQEGNHVLPAVWLHVLQTLEGLDWHHWHTWLFLYLALSIGAELAPSDVDLRYGLPALAAVAAGTWAFFFTTANTESLHQLGTAAELVLASALTGLSGILAFALIITTTAALVTVIPGMIIRALRV